MNILQKIIIPSVLILGGCSAMPSAEKESTEDPVFKDNKFVQTDFLAADEKIEGERYKVVKRALTGYGDISELRQYATKKADDICYEIGRNKEMLAVSERTTVPPFIWNNFPIIELTFVCVDYERNQPSASPVTVQNSPPVTNKKTSLFTDKYDRLLKIKALLDDGVLTQAEFDSEKKKILSEKY